MKERPINFNSDMVRAILEGRKTQTRRVIKPQPVSHSGGWYSHKSKGLTTSFKYSEQTPEMLALCPYGQVGDRLWVRETLRRSKVGTPTRYAADDCPVFRDGETPDTWDFKKSIIPSIFMPRWASRITLEITGVRVQRVQEISLVDIIAEGTPSFGLCLLRTSMLVTGTNNIDDLQRELSRIMFMEVWDSINTKCGYSWESNPWCWVLEFKKL